MIEKNVAKILAILAAVFLILTLTYYPPSYSIAPTIFLMGFIIMIFLIPEKAKHPSTMTEKVLTIFLILALLGCIVSVFALWKVGAFWRLR
jgi:hypothetical protein